MTDTCNDSGDDSADNQSEKVQHKNLQYKNWKQSMIWTIVDPKNVNDCLEIENQDFGLELPLRQLISNLLSTEELNDWDRAYLESFWDDTIIMDVNVFIKPKFHFPHMDVATRLIEARSESVHTTSIKSIKSILDVYVPSSNIHTTMDISSNGKAKSVETQTMDAKRIAPKHYPNVIDLFDNILMRDCDLRESDLSFFLQACPNIGYYIRRDWIETSYHVSLIAEAFDDGT